MRKEPIKPIFKLEKPRKGKIENYYFEEMYKDGKVSEDYLCCDGPESKTKINLIYIEFIQNEKIFKNFKTTLKINLLH